MRERRSMERACEGLHGRKMKDQKRARVEGGLKGGLKGGKKTSQDEMSKSLY